MSSWSAKLARVNVEVRARSANARGEPGVCAPVQAEAPAASNTSPSKGSEQDLLANFRARMARVTGLVPAESTPHGAAGGEPVLRAVLEPKSRFAPSPTPLGTLHVRRTVLASGHAAGRAPLETALRASAEMIGLLALDPSLACVDWRRALYVDTETTGLAMGAGTVAFVIGIGFFPPGSNDFVIEQLFVRDLAEEAPALAHFASQWQSAPAIVSYNGKSFDVPLLQSRCILNRLPILGGKPHLDLLHVARRVHGERLMKRNLASVEANVLGLARSGDVPSAEIPARYFHFLRTGDEQELASVVDHNALDIATLAALVGLYGEPLSGLGREDLVGVARTLGRARSFDVADEVLAKAIAAGAGSSALRVRAELARARGDKARALADFEVLAQSVNDPAVRLALAKLYEHHAKKPLEALEVALRGTGERPDQVARRRSRLEGKIAKRRR